MVTDTQMMQPPMMEDPRAGPVRAGDGREIQVVEFVLGDGQYAIDLYDVREVVEYTSITRLPNVPPYIRGIIDLRGEITTIVDLKEALGVPSMETLDSDSGRIIVLDDAITKSKTGVLVDDVTSVTTFEAGQVDRTSASLQQVENAVLGILKRRTRVRDRESNELIIWIDIRSLLRGLGIVH
jgi:purine-binding chemotaxis protein CheW